MRKRGKQAAVGGSSDIPQPAAHIRLEDLPSEAVELIAQHASTPSTPAACLLPLVCSSWGTAANSVQLLVDVTADLGPRLNYPEADVAAARRLQATSGRTTRARAAAAAPPPPPPAAAAAAAVPAALLRGRQLAAWLAKRRGSVRSLCIPRGPLYVYVISLQHVHEALRQGWEEDLTCIIKALLPKQQAPGGGTVLPHLVQLELPVLGLPGTEAFLEGLAGCTGLQRLSLQPPNFMVQSPVSFEQMGAALTPLQQLQTLHLEWPSPGTVMGACLAGLLRQLPPSLEQLQLSGIRCHPLTSIPLSCITHLVHLRAWELHDVPLVEDDVSSSSGASSSSSGVGHGAAGLTALTSLKCYHKLQGADARLQLPNLSFLHIETGAEPAAWEQLQGRAQLRELLIGGMWTVAPAELGQLTQVQHLQLLLRTPSSLTPAAAKPWAIEVTSLVRLKKLYLPGLVLLAGGPALLTPLTQLEHLAVAFSRDGLPAGFAPAKTRGWAATPVGAVVGVVAAAAAGGWGPLQHLVLVNTYWTQEVPRKVTKASAAARAALPGVEVEVRWAPRV